MKRRRNKKHNILTRYLWEAKRGVKCFYKQKKSEICNWWNEDGPGTIFLITLIVSIFSFCLPLLGPALDHALGIHP